MFWDIDMVGGVIAEVIYPAWSTSPFEHQIVLGVTTDMDDHFTGTIFYDSQWMCVDVV